jgi:hypothetical protein
MSGPVVRKRPQPWHAVVLVLATWFAHYLGCSARDGRRPPAAAPRPSAATTGSAAAAGASSPARPSCRVRRAPRTFVGFSAGMSLEHFELAAFEAERVLTAVEIQLCDLDAALDPHGSLRAAVRDGAIELAAVVFTQDDAGAADVHARELGDAPASPVAAPQGTPSWSLRAMRTADVWRVVAVGVLADEVVARRLTLLR